MAVQVGPASLNNRLASVLHFLNQLLEFKCDGKQQPVSWSLLSKGMQALKDADSHWDGQREDEGWREKSSGEEVIFKKKV